MSLNNQPQTRFTIFLFTDHQWKFFHTLVPCSSSHRKTCFKWLDEDGTSNDNFCATQRELKLWKYKKFFNFLKQRSTVLHLL